MLELEHAELRERRLQRELVAVAAVDAGHERLDERLVRLPPEAARDERADRLVEAPPPSRHVDLRGEASLAGRGQERARLERLEVRRDHPGQALGERVELVSAAHERPVMLRPAADELVAEAELLAQPDPALLPRQEAVGRSLDDEAVDVLRPELPAELRLALERAAPRRRARAPRAGARLPAPRSRPRRRRLSCRRSHSRRRAPARARRARR